MATDYDEATLCAMMMDDIGVQRRMEIMRAKDDRDRDISNAVARQEETALQAHRRPIEGANIQALKAWKSK